MDVNLKVLDISHHNDVASFGQIYDFGIRGIIHKATQGAGYVDPMYERRRQQAIEAGLKWGAYHFADASDPEAQVRHFIEAAKPDADTLMALDFEPNGQSTMDLDGCRTFLRSLETALGRKGVLYSGNLIKETLGDESDDYLGAHRLWLAQYGSHAVVPDAWSGKGAWLWQFSGDGVNSHGIVVPGISGEIDMNAYNGNDEDLAAQWA